MEQHENFDFEIKKAIVMQDKATLVYCYEIHTQGCPPYEHGIIESDEWFDKEQEARFAAIGHIELLLSGEG